MPGADQESDVLTFRRQRALLVTHPASEVIVCRCIWTMEHMDGNDIADILWAAAMCA